MRHLLRLRIVPLAQLGGQLQKPRQTIRALETRTAFSAHVRRLLRELLRSQTLSQRLAYSRHKRGVGKTSHQAREQPMSVHGRMPVKTAVESRGQFARRQNIGIAA